MCCALPGRFCCEINWFSRHARHISPRGEEVAGDAMTLEIDPLPTQHSQILDANLRRHAFHLLRRGAAVKSSDAIATSPSGADAAKATLETLAASGMAEVQGDRLIGIDGLTTRPNAAPNGTRGRRTVHMVRPRTRWGYRPPSERTRS